MSALDLQRQCHQ